MPGPASQEHAEKLQRLLAGKWVSAAISAAASLRLAEAMGEEDTSLETIARATHCNAQFLNRLLRVLTAEGFFVRTAPDTYALTDLGALLRQDEFGSLAQMIGAPFAWNPWSQLPQAVQGENAAFELAHGATLFDHLERNAGDAELYHRAIDAFTRREAEALRTRFDFARVRGVADIGGGRGRLLCELISHREHLRGALIERRAAASRARENVGEAGLAERCKIIEGSFFDWESFAALPSHIDTLILKHVLHNWSDEDALVLLGNCARYLEEQTEQGSLLIIEGFLLPGDHGGATNLLDLEMLVLCGAGRERSKPEMRRLLHRAGLTMQKSESFGELSHILTCTYQGSR